MDRSRFVVARVLLRVLAGLAWTSLIIAAMAAMMLKDWIGLAIIGLLFVFSIILVALNWWQLHFRYRGFYPNAVAERILQRHRA